MPIPSVVGNPLALGLGDALQGYLQGKGTAYQRQIGMMQAQGENAKNLAQASYYQDLDPTKRAVAQTNAMGRIDGAYVHGQLMSTTAILEALAKGAMDWSDLPPGAQQAVTSYGDGPPIALMDGNSNFVPPGISWSGTGTPTPPGQPAPASPGQSGPTTPGQPGPATPGQPALATPANTTGNGPLPTQATDNFTKFLSIMGGTPLPGQRQAVRTFNQTMGTNYPMPGMPINIRVPTYGPPPMGQTSLPDGTRTVGYFPYYNSGMAAQTVAPPNTAQSGQLPQGVPQQPNNLIYPTQASPQTANPYESPYGFQSGGQLNLDFFRR